MATRLDIEVGAKVDSADLKRSIETPFETVMAAAAGKGAAAMKAAIDKMLRELQTDVHRVASELSQHRKELSEEKEQKLLAVFGNKKKMADVRSYMAVKSIPIHTASHGLQEAKGVIGETYGMFTEQVREIEAQEKEAERQERELVKQQKEKERKLKERKSKASGIVKQKIAAERRRLIRTDDRFKDLESGNLSPEEYASRNRELEGELINFARGKGANREQKTAYGEYVTKGVVKQYKEAEIEREKKERISNESRLNQQRENLERLKERISGNYRERQRELVDRRELVNKEWLKLDKEYQGRKEDKHYEKRTRELRAADRLLNNQFISEEEVREQQLRSRGRFIGGAIGGAAMLGGRIWGRYIDLAKQKELLDIQEEDPGVAAIKKEAAEKQAKADTVSTVSKSLAGAAGAAAFIPGIGWIASAALLAASGITYAAGHVASKKIEKEAAVTEATKLEERKIEKEVHQAGRIGTYLWGVSPEAQVSGIMKNKALRDIHKFGLTDLDMMQSMQDVARGRGYGYSSTSTAADLQRFQNEALDIALLKRGGILDSGSIQETLRHQLPNLEGGFGSVMEAAQVAANVSEMVTGKRNDFTLTNEYLKEILNVEKRHLQLTGEFNKDTTTRMLAGIAGMGGYFSTATGMGSMYQTLSGGLANAITPQVEALQYQNLASIAPEKSLWGLEKMKELGLAAGPEVIEGFMNQLEGMSAGNDDVFERLIHNVFGEHGMSKNLAETFRKGWQEKGIQSIDWDVFGKTGNLQAALGEAAEAATSPAEEEIARKKQEWVRRSMGSLSTMDFKEWQKGMSEGKREVVKGNKIDGFYLEDQSSPAAITARAESAKYGLTGKEGEDERREKIHAYHEKEREEKIAKGGQQATNILLAEIAYYTGVSSSVMVDTWQGNIGQKA